MSAGVARVDGGATVMSLASGENPRPPAGRGCSWRAGQAVALDLPTQYTSGTKVWSVSGGRT